MRIFKYYFLLFLLIFSQSCYNSKTHYRAAPKDQAEPSQKMTPVILGSENLIASYIPLFKDKKLGLLTNPSGIDRSFRMTANILHEHPDLNLTTLFGPEHGIRGAVYGGEKIEDGIDPETGLPVYSLYGKNRKPTPEMLSDVDVILVDIQDIGIRAYTYIYTMALIMEAAAENEKEVIILDRPNPIGGIAVEGNLVEEEWFSFVGLYPIPYRPGMTIGELAKLFNSEYEINCKLTVIPLKNWQRDMLWPETGLPWVPPSPHVPNWETVLFMPVTGLIGELHTVSVGVGYTSPFELIGAPWMVANLSSDKLKALQLPGIFFRPLTFKPYYSTYKGEVCQGVQLHITDQEQFRPYEAGIHILHHLVNTYPEQDIFSNLRRMSMFTKVIGTEKIVQSLQNGKTTQEIIDEWQPELESFLKIREKYLIYKN